VDELFSSRIVNSRVVTRHELRAVGETIRYGSFSDALAAFRGKFDAALVPSYLTKDASELFAQLAAKAHSGNERDLEELKGALFNLRLPPAEAVQAVADFMSRTNSRKPVSGFDHFISIACPALPDGCVSVAASVAAASLLDRGERLSSDFLKLFFYWSSDRDRLPDPLREKVESVIRITWNGRNDYPSPLAAPASPFRTKGFHEIHEDLLRNFPKTLKSSSEE
jgi:hypothetical protein